MKKIHFSQRLIFIIWIFLELIAERMYGKYIEFDLNFRNLQSVTPISPELNKFSINIDLQDFDVVKSQCQQIFSTFWEVSTKKSILLSLMCLSWLIKQVSLPVLFCDVGLNV